MTKPKPADFLKSMKDAIKGVLDDPDASAVEKMKAVQSGIQLLEYENEAKGGKRNDGHFFSGKR